MSIVFVALFALVVAGFSVLRQYKRGLVVRLGRYQGTREAGLTWIVPLVRSAGS